MKNNKGASLVDVVVSILILSLFAGIIGSLFYQIGYYSNLAKYNALATHYAVKVAEDIDKMAYESVTNQLNTNIIPNYNVRDGYEIRLDVRNYNDRDNTKQDILKIVTINVDYSFRGRTETYKIEKLKVKEF
jgi:hypothetical protein